MAETLRSTGPRTGVPIPNTEEAGDRVGGVGGAAGTDVEWPGRGAYCSAHRGHVKTEGHDGHTRHRRAQPHAGAQRGSVRLCGTLARSMAGYLGARADQMPAPNLPNAASTCNTTSEQAQCHAPAEVHKDMVQRRCETNMEPGKRWARYFSAQTHRPVGSCQGRCQHRRPAAPVRAQHRTRR